MNLISRVSSICILLLTFSNCNGQIKNAKTESVKIYGNCKMCETTIEKAGNAKKTAQVNWNKDTKLAIVTYDTIKTNKTDILKRIALAGYDSEGFLAPDDVYGKLAECCRYKRVNKSAALQPQLATNHASQNHQNVQNETNNVEEINQLEAVFDAYFSLKNALIKSDQKSASALAKNLLSTINEVKMDKLSAKQHTVWMKVLSNLKSNSDKITNSSAIEKQRNVFMNLSANMYDLIKVSKPKTPIYYQNCPMYNDGKGANWLSKENAIKNPYYGSQMLSCGQTVETIK